MLTESGDTPTVKSGAALTVKLSELDGPLGVVTVMV